MDQTTVDIIQVLLFAVLLAVAWFFNPFRQLKKEMAEFDWPQGLSYRDEGERARVWGTVDSCEIEVESYRAWDPVKKHHIAVRGAFTFPQAPSGFCLYPEGFGTGMERLAERKEMELGDPDFDDAFWVTADDPQALRDYLSESRRKALLHWLVRMGDGVVEDGVLTRKDQQAGLVHDGIGRTVSQFLGLAKAFAGDDQYHRSTAEMKRGWVAARKTRVMALYSGILALVFYALPEAIPMPSWAVEYDHVLLWTSVATCLGAVFAQRKLVLVLTSLLGVMMGMALLGMAGLLAVQGQYLAAMLPLLFTVAWVIVWLGLLMHLKALKGR